MVVSSVGIVADVLMLEFFDSLSSVLAFVLELCCCNVLKILEERVRVFMEAEPSELSISASRLVFFLESCNADAN
jgi:hypothetical protein